MDEAASTNDKVIFAVSFLAVLVTLSTYKDYLTKMSIGIFSHSYSVFELLTYISLILFCSVYFSAIDKLRYSTLKLTRLKFLEVSSFIADFFYLVAILLLPGLFISFYFCSYIYSNIVFPLLTNYSFNFFYMPDVSMIISIISGIVTILAIINSFYITKQQRNENIRELIKDSDDI